MAPPKEGELVEELILPAGLFKQDDIKSRRASCFQRRVRSRLVSFPETDNHHAYYKLTLIGPAHEMAFATMLFSFFDDREFLLRK